MYQLELPFLDPVFTVEVIANNGKRYRLEDGGYTKSVCEGCAFNAHTCMSEIDSDDCMAPELGGRGVWKEIV